MNKIVKFSIAAFLAISVLCLYGAYQGFAIQEKIQADKIFSNGGYAYTSNIGVLNTLDFLIGGEGDSLEQPKKSSLRLYEEGVLLGPPHVGHNIIRLNGMGSYSHWGDVLYFSASDNSAPRINKRIYHIEYILYINPVLAWLIIISFISLSVILGKSCRRKPWLWISYAMLTGVAVYCLDFALPLTHGVLFYAVFALYVVGVVWLVVLTVHVCRVLLSVSHGFIQWVLLRVKKMPDSLIGLSGAKTLTMSLVSLALVLMLAEASIGLVGKYVKSNADQMKQTITQSESAIGSAPLSIPVSTEGVERIRYRAQFVTMPKSWKSEIIKVPGSVYSVRWHNVIHVHNRENFRRTTPFPPKSKEKFRILIIGDSYTYGWGIEAKFGFPALLQKKLSQGYNVELLNLGNNGAQSEEIFNVLKTQVPKLEPDLVLYEVTLNDFLGSGVGQEVLTKPKKIKIFVNYLKEHSKLAKFIYDRWHVLEIRMGFTDDFYGQLLRYIDKYSARFYQDVKAMEVIIEQHNLPPIIAMVADQTPSLNGPGFKLAKIADEALKRAGLQLIPSEPYYRRYNGKRMVVSRWEGHPNEEANAIFASRFYDQLIKLDILKKYRKN